MSINSSDFSQQGVNYSSKPEQSASEQFAAQRRADAKMIQQTGSAQEVNKEKQNANSGYAAVKIEPYDIEAMNDKMSQLNVQLTFEVAEGREQNIVKVLDQTTGDVVRQIPTEEFLKMSERIDVIMTQLSDIKGNLVNSQA